MPEKWPTAHSGRQLTQNGLSYSTSRGYARKMVPTPFFAAALVVLIVSAAIGVDGRQTADDIAHAIVIGQAYTSGNVYVGGFSHPNAQSPRVGDPATGDEKREWPKRVTLTALRTPNALPLTAAFSRALAPDSEELFYFPQREDGGSAGPEDLFSTIDSMMVTDANLALYRSTAKVNKPLAVFGWDDSIAIGDVSFRESGQPRPVTEAERQEIAADKKSRAPKDVECTTEPQFLDAAKVMLTARVGKTRTAIRLSTYATAGCAGHLSEIYVLDVLEAGREPRRFEFRHYAGVL